MCYPSFCPMWSPPAVPRTGVTGKSRKGYSLSIERWGEIDPLFLEANPVTAQTLEWGTSQAGCISLAPSSSQQLGVESVNNERYLHFSVELTKHFNKQGFIFPTREAADSFISLQRNLKFKCSNLNYSCNS